MVNEIQDFCQITPVLLSIARGDTFAEEDYVTEVMTTVIPTVAPTLPSSPSDESTQQPTQPTQPTDPDAAPCSGRPFDAFLQLKNGSIYAFRGTVKQDNRPTACCLKMCDCCLLSLAQHLLFNTGVYFFELDDTSILPGYPKLIQDVWGIEGPIDAAFTRVNCQGKSYIFKVRTCF